MEFELEGEPLRALSERALYAPRRRTLLIADLHLGKTDAFRAAGVPLPDGATHSDLDRLERCLSRRPVERLIVLGDLIHDASGMAPGMIERFARWRSRRENMEIMLVRGNHDRHVRDLPPAWGIDCVEEPYRWFGIDLRHHPTDDVASPQIAGHIHPVVRLEGRGGQRAKLPCFWRRERRLVLPAFTEFAGGGRIEPQPGDGVYVVVENAVIEAPTVLAPVATDVRHEA